MYRGTSGRFQSHVRPEVWDNIRILLTWGHRAKDIARVYKFLGVNEQGIYERNSDKWHIKLRTGARRGPKCPKCRLRKPVYRSRLCKDCYNVSRRKPLGRPTGARHWNWQGGRTKTVEFLRFLPQYKRWRKAIFIRDNYKCVECGKGGRLEADHSPIPLSAIVREFNINSLESAIKCKLLWDIGNGRTLCKDCHRRTPTYGTKAKNYKIIYG